MVSTLHLHFQIKPPRLRQQVAMPGQEPELDGFARMIGGGAWIPNGLGDRSQGLVLNSVECMWYPHCSIIVSSAWVLGIFGYVRSLLAPLPWTLSPLMKSWGICWHTIVKLLGKNVAPHASKRIWVPTRQVGALAAKRVSIFIWTRKGAPNCLFLGGLSNWIGMESIWWTKSYIETQL